MTPFEKELSFMFMATAFTRLFIEGSKNKNALDMAEALEKELMKKARLYFKKGKKVTAYAQTILTKCEDELKVVKENKFRKKVAFNDEGDIEAHGLLLSVSLILEHQQLKNRKMFLPYRLAESIYKSFNKVSDDKYVHNAKILAHAYADRV